MLDKKRNLKHFYWVCEQTMIIYFDDDTKSQSVTPNSFIFSLRYLIFICFLMFMCCFRGLLINLISKHHWLYLYCLDMLWLSLFVLFCLNCCWFLQLLIYKPSNKVHGWYIRRPDPNGWYFGFKLLWLYNLCLG